VSEQDPVRVTVELLGTGEKLMMQLGAEKKAGWKLPPTWVSASTEKVRGCPPH
jgi:hypothetical protein